MLNKYAYSTFSNHVELERKLVLTAKSGTPASATLDIVTNKIPHNYFVKSTGKTTINETSVAVAADATSTDSINGKYLQVIVED